MSNPDHYCPECHYWNHHHAQGCHRGASLPGLAPGVAFEKVLSARHPEDVSNAELRAAAEYTRLCQFSLSSYVLRLTQWLIDTRRQRDDLE